MIDTTQPFYVPIGRGRLNLHTGQRGGYYLPALESKNETPTETPTDWSGKQWDMVEQLLAEVKHLREKWYQHLKEDRDYRANIAKRKPNKYNVYK